MKHENGREKSQHTFTLLTNQILSRFYYCYLRALIAGLSLSALPAALTGCDSVPYSDEVITCSSYSINFVRSLSSFTGRTGTLDILVFNDDALKRLDAYQRIDGFNSSKAYPTSSGGDKIMFFYYGPPKDRYEWAEINSYSSLCKMSCDLESETIESPVMTGCCRCSAGEEEEEVQTDMKPLTSRVRLQSLRCDFSGTSYSSQTIEDVKAYLINVNATSGILPDDSRNHTRIINSGMLNMLEVMKFKDQNIIFQAITDRMDNRTVYPKTEFLCYPKTDDPSRSTKLVIEGRINGNTYYWPVNVGEDGHTERGITYSYSILIRRKGTSDPDLPLEPRDIEIDYRIVPWEEKEAYQENF